MVALGVGLAALRRLRLHGDDAGHVVGEPMGDEFLPGSRRPAPDRVNHLDARQGDWL